MIDKPAGLVCHPTKDGEDSSLISQLRSHLRHQPEAQPALLHRLDRETSGVILVSKTLQVRQALQKGFEKGWVEKEYLYLRFIETGMTPQLLNMENFLKENRS